MGDSRFIRVNSFQSRRNLMATLCLLLAWQKSIGANEGRGLNNARIKAIEQEASQAAKHHEKEVKNKLEAAQNSVVSQYQQRCPLHQNCFGSREEAIHKIPTKENGFEESHTSLVFVSSSMPKTALIALGNQAKRLGARLIIRGMVNNSMKDTALLVKEINHPLDIDPKLFKKFTVHQVPTFVIPRISKGVQEWGVLQGNVSLEFALEAGKGETMSDHQGSHP
jgi:conjugal transfer pilus assembly protein TrbC